MTTWGCGGCDRRWTSLSQAHCAKCHEHFATVGVSDHHDRGGDCRHPRDVLRKSGKQRYRGTLDKWGGVVWRSAERRVMPDA